jgi:hypothetical protein
MKKLAEYFVESEQGHIRPQVGDSVDIVVNEELAIEAGVLESTEDKLVLEYDERGISLLEGLDLIEEETELDEEQTPSQAEAMEAGKKAARNGEKYDSNPYESNSPESIAWSVGHNVARTTMMKKEDVDLDVNEGKIKDMLLDIEELTDKEFQDKYNMSKNDAKEQFDLDEASCGMKKRYEDASAEEEDKFHTELDKLMHRTFGHSSDERGEKMKKSTQDAFQELKDYAETSGGIDKEEFEKAAYLVKAMGKPHLKDKAEGMLDDLIGKMDSDPRDKVIQVLSHHIDLTFLKNLLDEAEVELDEKYDSDKFFDGKGTPEQRTQLLKLQNKALRAFPSSPKQKEIKKEIDALRKKMGMKVKEEVELDEAEYQGRKVKLGKPMRGDVAKYKVYVKDKKTGNVKKVNFGDKNMEIKRDDPKRRKSFRARHGCGTPKASDRTKARYWSCRMWSSKPVSKIV